ncbi:hypothetical protein F5887DRAFT_989331 [Amanita rubescens]|nr:hypothetical protein F5887DRAFT_989331 [Amanita rubescens]
MQRRGKAQLRIASPGQTDPLMASDSQKSSRSNLNRVWLIVAIVTTFIILVHFLSPSYNESSSHPTYSNANLKAKNYLRSSDQPNPFDFCPVFGPGDDVGNKYGPIRLGQSRLHMGSGARVLRVLNRALAGHPVTISVIGGSISSCHGAGDDPIAPICYPSRFFQWWNTVFPHPASELTNGAMRRTDSRYFSFCSAHHLPDHSDLIIVELDTEDSSDAGAMEHFETLIRSILIRPDSPAVVLLGHFSRQTHQSNGYAGPDHWHNVVARFYDVPHLSAKSIFLPDYFRDPTSINKYYADPVLANSAGHQVLSEILITYFQAQTCLAWDIAHGKAFDAIPFITPGNLPGDPGHLFGGIGQRQGVPEHEPVMEPGVPHDEDSDPLTDDKPQVPENIRNAIQQNHLLHVPQGRISTRLPSNTRPFQEIAPFCVSANNLINPLPPSLFYGSGWLAHHPQNFGPSPNLHATAHYWFSTFPTSKIRIPIQVGAGDIGVYYLKEPLSLIGEGSEISCWVDDNVGGARTIMNAANVGEPTSALEIIDHGVTRGSHYVECLLMGEEGKSVPMFKIMGIFST